MRKDVNEIWEKQPNGTMKLISEEVVWVDDTEEIKQWRATAYRQEADPLYFKVQRGEKEQQEWLDKVEEIRARYPYSTDEREDDK